MENKEKIAKFPNISLKKIYVNPGTPKEMVNWYWGWWEGLVPTGIYSCYLEKDSSKCWKQEVWVDSNGVTFIKKSKY